MSSATEQNNVCALPLNKTMYKLSQWPKQCMSSAGKQNQILYIMISNMLNLYYGLLMHLLAWIATVTKYVLRASNMGYPTPNIQLIYPYTLKRTCISLYSNCRRQSNWIQTWSKLISLLFFFETLRMTSMAHTLLLNMPNPSNYPDHKAQPNQKAKQMMITKHKMDLGTL